MLRYGTRAATDHLGVLLKRPAESLTGTGQDAKALDVHHLLWDGTEGWKATVTPPQDVDASTLTPHISWDDGLGAVAFWYTTDQSTENEAVVSLSPPPPSAGLTPTLVVVARSP